MSISIDELREMYTEERERSKVLKEIIDRQDKRIDRLVNEYNRLGDELQSARNDNRRESSADEETKRKLQSQLDAVCDTNKEPADLNVELQMALDDVDKPEASDDGDYVQELENRLEEIQLELNTRNVSHDELQVKNQLLRNQLKNAVAGDWEHVRPYLDEKLRKCCADFKAELGSCRAELSKVKADSANLREENRALKEDLKSMSAAPKIDAQKKKKKRRKAAAKTKMSPGESELLKLKDRDSVYTW
ncbi:hypothetical protein BDR22DRAFT_960485 [Usnea florida]